MKKIGLIITSILFSGMTYGGDLKSPFVLSSAKVLPKGVRNLSYKGVYTGATEKYDENSSKTIVADPFFRRITVQDLIDGKKDPAEKGALINALNAIGASADEDFGSTTGQVNVKATAHVPVFAWGINEKWTLALAVPILQYAVNVDTGVIQDNQALHAALVQELNLAGASSKVAEFNSKMRDPVQAKLEEYGYETLKNESGTKLGDIKIVSKHQVLNRDFHTLTVSGELTLPTGEDQNVNKVVDITSGDDQTDIGLGLAYDYSATKDITLLAGTSYTLQLPDSSPERIPERPDSKLTPDVDSETERDLGDIFVSTLGTRYSRAGFSAGFAYTYQYKARDNYEGNQFASERYAWLENETTQEMHSAQLSIGYDTISLFQQKKFAVPLGVSINHTRVISGRNVVKDPLTSLDLNIFF